MTNADVLSLQDCQVVVHSPSQRAVLYWKVGDWEKRVYDITLDRVFSGTLTQRGGKAVYVGEVRGCYGSVEDVATYFDTAIDSKGARYIMGGVNPVQRSVVEHVCSPECDQTPRMGGVVCDATVTPHPTEPLAIVTPWLSLTSVCLIKRMCQQPDVDDKVHEFMRALEDAIGDKIIQDVTFEVASVTGPFMVIQVGVATHRIAYTMEEDLKDFLVPFIPKDSVELAIQHM